MDGWDGWRREQLARATRTRRRPRRKGPNLAGPTVVSFRAVLECTNAVLRQAKLPKYFFVHVNAAPPPGAIMRRWSPDIRWRAGVRRDGRQPH